MKQAPVRTQTSNRSTANRVVNLHDENQGSRTEEESHWFTDPPTKKNKEWHPEKGELYAEVDGSPFGQCRRRAGFSEKVAKEILDKKRASHSPVGRK